MLIEHSHDCSLRNNSNEKGNVEILHEKPTWNELGAEERRIMDELTRKKKKNSGLPE